MPRLEPKLSSVRQGETIPVCKRGEITSEVHLWMTGLEKHKCALHPERPSTGKAASLPPLPAKALIPGMRNQSKWERSPGQGCGQSFLTAGNPSRQPAGRAPSCLHAGPDGWECWCSCWELGKRQHRQPSQADTQGWVLSLQSSVFTHGECLPSAQCPGLEQSCALGSGHRLFCVEIGKREDFNLLSPSRWGNCYLPAAISPNLVSSLEMSNLTFSLVKVKNCSLTVLRLNPPYFSVRKHTHSNQNDSWYFNTRSNTAPSSTTGFFLHFWWPFFHLTTCFLSFSERVPLDKNNAGLVRHHCEYQWRGVFFSFCSHFLPWAKSK